MKAGILFLALWGAGLAPGWTQAASPAPVLPRPVLVTVDDLPVASGRLHPHPEERQKTTEALLAALARHQVPAVGFVIWGNVRTDADRRILDLWLQAGHELGNHTATHPDLTRTTAEEFVADAEAARRGLAEFLAARGRKGPRFFRFPMLREGETEAKRKAVGEYLEQSGQRPVPVTIDNQDYAFEEAWLRQQETAGEDYLAALRTMVAYHERRGDALLGRQAPQVLLLHANAVGAGNWDRLFTWLEATGHRFATADEVLADPAFAATPAIPERFGFSLWDRMARRQDHEKARKEIQQLLETQAEAWNRGDLTAFTSVYADEALFITPSGLTRGRAAVLERYRKRYPDAAARGRLKFEFVDVVPCAGTEVSVFGDAAPGRVHSASVAARWILQQEGRPGAAGWTLLVLHRQGDRWVIIQDASM